MDRMELDAATVIERFGLVPHPEGGHFRETWRAPAPGGGRGAGTAIYFLLRRGEVSHWHRVDAAETWHVYAGAPLDLQMSTDGTSSLPVVLGSDVVSGETPQLTVPANVWQSARSLGEWTLCGCTVAPAFMFDGFELAPRTWAPTVLGPVVGPAWLRHNRDTVVLCDVRWYLDGRSGRAAFESGHIPGAAFVDLDKCLAAPPSPEAGRHPLPDPDVFAAGMAEAGVGDTSVVVAYDDQGGMAAGRLVWMLRALGHTAALLDGGIQAWDRPLAAGPAAAKLEPVTFTGVPWPVQRLAGAAELAWSVAGRVVVDARAPERFRGEVEPVDARPGHIPGAVNMPYTANLERPAGRFLPLSALEHLYAGTGALSGCDVVVYCGSGVSACLDLLALEALGVARARLYAGSYSQWAADRARPVVT